MTMKKGMMPVVLTIPKDSEVPNILENPERWQRVQYVFPHSHEGDFILSFWQRLSPKNDYFFSFSYPCSGIGTFLPSRVDLPVPAALDWMGNYQYKVRDQTEYISKLETRYSSHQSRDPRTNTAIPVSRGARQYDDPWFSQSTSIVNCSVFHMIKIQLNF